MTIHDIAELLSRRERLKRAERDLEGRVATQVTALEQDGGWYLSDPLYQRLWTALVRVRYDLRRVEESLAPRFQ
jgi:hypothetical protein